MTMRKLINGKTIYTLLLMTIPLLAMAQGKVKSNPILEWTYENIFLVMGLMVIVGVGLTLWNAMNGIVEYQQKELLKEQGIEYVAPKREDKEWLGYTRMVSHIGSYQVLFYQMFLTLSLALQ